jgi:hypothetical protein
VRATRMWAGAAALVVAVMTSVAGAGATSASETPQVRISNLAFGIESHGGRVPALVPITLSGPSAAPVTLHYATTNFDGDTATPKVDYKPVAGDLTIVAGDVQAAINVPILPDHFQDPNETFHVVISDVVGATVQRSVTEVVIRDSYSTDAMLGSEVHYDSENVGRWKTYIAKVTFTLIDHFDHDVTAQYLTTPQTATAGVDYVFKRGAITIPAGKLSASVTVRLIKREASDDRSFFVRLYPITGLPNPDAQVSAGVGLLPQGSA